MMFFVCFQLRVASEVDLEMCYFNDSLASWEPLLEPVMETEGHYRPWHLILKVRQKYKPWKKKISKIVSMLNKKDIIISMG